MGDTVSYELDGHVATITYNRPDALNAINADMRRDLNAAFRRFRDDEDAWVAIVTAFGPRLLRRRRPARRSRRRRGVRRHVLGEADAQLLRERLGDLQAGHRRGERVLPGLRAHPGHLVRLRRGQRPAEFGLPEVRLGVPAVVASIRLPQRINWADAMELLLTGERIDADRAHAMGLVWKVVPHDTLLDEAHVLAARCCSGAPLAQRVMKEMAMRTRHMAPLEAIRFAETMRIVANATPDAEEGPPRHGRTNATPEWTGRA